MRVSEISCKTALSPSRLPGLDYTLNPYIGCQHQCIYCYAPSILHMPRNEWETSIKVKRNIPLILSKELKQKKRGVIGLSTVTDPYQPIEKTYKITQYCLKVIQKKNFPLCIQTKSDLILRDKELIKNFDNVEVMVSIGTPNEGHKRILEPSSSTIIQRLSILKAFSDTPVKTSVFFGPIYPSITPDDIPEILDVFIDYQVDEIMIDYLHTKNELMMPLTHLIQNNPQLPMSYALEKLMNQKTTFQVIRETIYAYLKHTDITVTDAF